MMAKVQVKLYVPEDLKIRAKSKAALENISMSEYWIRALEEKMKQGS